jgi:hypothetical protein
MRMRKILDLGLVILLVFIGFSLTQRSKDQVKEKMSLVNDSFQVFLSTDKKTYHSNELMRINLKIIAWSEIDAKLKIWGLRGKLSREEEVKINRGLNHLTIDYDLPACNVCGGIPEGSYELRAELLQGEEIVAKALTRIELRQ